MRLVKQIDARQDCGSTSRAPAILENRSVPWAYTSQHLSPLYTINIRKGDPISSILALPSLPLSHNATPWSMWRGWLPAVLGTVFPRRPSPSSPSRWPRLRRLHSKTFVVCGCVTIRRRGRPRATPSPIASTSSITTKPRFGVLTQWTHTSKPLTSCKVRTTEEPSSSRGWATYARADPVMWHSSHEQKRKEIYKRPTYWPSSSTAHTAQPTIFSTTSGASTMKSLLVHRSEHGGGWRTGTMTRMMQALWVFTTEFRMR
jgi:hypothetical protein